MRLVGFGILLILSSLWISGCNNVPQITPCILSPFVGLAYCAPGAGGAVYDKKISEMDKFTCFSPDDTQKLFEYFKRQKAKPTAETKQQMNFIKSVIDSDEVKLFEMEEPHGGTPKP